MVRLSIFVREVANMILEKLDKLPGSKNDVNAFMVKHANKSSNSTVEVLITRLRNTKIKNPTNILDIYIQKHSKVT